jgi:hypothetical protein
MLNTKQSVRLALILLPLSFVPSNVLAQTQTEPIAPASAPSTPSNAARLGVQEVGIQDFVFEQSQPPRLREISVKRELEVKLVPPPDRQNTVFNNTEGVQVQVRPGKPKSNP